jgi:hypothetical protein
MPFQLEGMEISIVTDCTNAKFFPMSMNEGSKFASLVPLQGWQNLNYVSQVTLGTGIYTENRLLLVPG